MAQPLHPRRPPLLGVVSLLLTLTSITAITSITATTPSHRSILGAPPLLSGFEMASGKSCWSQLTVRETQQTNRDSP